jgi:hypothetical protein
MILQILYHSRGKVDPVEGGGEKTPRGSTHPFMIPGEFLQVEGGVVFTFHLLFVVGTFFVVIVRPELPSMGMGSSHMGALVIRFDMGMNQEEGRECEEQVGHRQEHGKMLPMSTLSLLVDESDHIPPWSHVRPEVHRKLQIRTGGVKIQAGNSICRIFQVS